MKRKLITMILTSALVLSLPIGGTVTLAAEDVSGTIVIWEHDYSFEDSLTQHLTRSIRM